MYGREDFCPISAGRRASHAFDGFQENFPFVRRDAIWAAKMVSSFYDWERIGRAVLRSP